MTTDRHDLFRQFEYVRQALSQNKKPIGFFLGAGCPLAVKVNQRTLLADHSVVSDPLIPDVAGLTATVTDQLGSADPATPNNFDKLLKSLQDDGFDNPNVEDLLTRVRSLLSVAGKGDVRGFATQDLVELDKGICATISAAVSKELPDESTPYHDLAIWTRSIERSYPVHVFTPNYDLLVEQAFEESATPYFDGFVGARRAFFDLGAVENERLLHPRWTRLWKLHGSINWRLDAKKNVVRGDQMRKGESYLIYPSHLKYLQSRKMPYLAMLDRLQDFLLTPSSIMFICGYSFNDENINDVLSSSLSNNPTAMTYVFLYGSLDDPRYSKAKHCALAAPNLTLAAFDKAVIGREEGPWRLGPDKLAAMPKNIATQRYQEGGTQEDSYELRLGCFAALGTLLRTLSRSETSHDTE